MKILVIVPSYKPAFVYGGPIRSIASLCESLGRSGISVDVWTTNANGKKKLDVAVGVPHKIEGVSVTYFNRWTGDHSNFSPSLLIRLIREVKTYDVIHIQSWWNMVAVPAAMVCRIKGIRPIISPRGSLTSFTLKHGQSKAKTLLHWLIGKNLLNKSILHLTSEREQKESVQFSPISKKCIIPNIPEPIEKMAIDRTGDVFQVLFLGRIDPAKNIEILLKVFSGIMPFKSRLIIAGTGKKEYVEYLKSSVDSLNAINWIGQVEGKKKHELIASSDVLVLPSYTENFGNVVLESLAQGTPVMISEGVGIKDFIQKHNLGLIVSGDAENWRNALKKLHNDPPLRNYIRSTAPLKVRQVFGEETLVEKYLMMYRDVNITPSSEQKVLNV